MVTARQFRQYINIAKAASSEATGKVEYEWINADNDAMSSLVFLHEGLGCMTLWRDFPAHIAEKTGTPAFIYSRFGYGGSDPIVLPRQRDYMHIEGELYLPEILSKAGIETPILIGHSDGASIALIYAALNATSPTAKALVLMAPHVFAEQISIDSIARIGDQFRNGTLRERLQKHHGDNVDNAFWGWHDAWLAADFRDWNIESLLAQITIPVLLLQGEQDQYGTLAQIHTLENQLHGPVETLIIPNCGHSPHRDQSRICESAIIKFLGRL